MNCEAAQILLNWPQFVTPAGRSCTEVATTLDILPTIAGLVGGEVPSDRVIDGKDILPLMKGIPGAKSPHNAYAYIYKDGGVRSGKWKYYPFRAGIGAKDRLKKGDLRTQAPVQLYDLSTDLHEEKNLAEQNPEVVMRLHKALEELKTDIENNKRPSGRE